MRTRIAAVLAGAALVTTGAATAATASTPAAFSTVPSPNVAGSDYNELDGVAAVTPADAWAVGFARTTGPQFNVLVEHWNGTAWSIAASASLPAGEDTRLHALSALSAHNIWAVGSAGSQSLIEHWNGTAWSVVPSPAAEPADSVLYEVAAVSARDVWAVGHSVTETGEGSGTLIEHWNGSAWSVVPSPGLSGTGYGYLTGIAAVSARDVWAVGRDQRHPDPVIEHWNGTAWKLVSQPVDGYDSSLNSVAVVNGSDIWAVGEQNLDQTVTERWNGTKWKLVPSPSITTDNAQDTLTSVAALGAGDVWTVGSYTPLDRSTQTLAEHWDGSRWQIVPTTDPGSGFDELTGVSGTATGAPLWGAGFGFGGTPQDVTLMETTTG